MDARVVEKPRSKPDVLVLPVSSGSGDPSGASQEDLDVCIDVGTPSPPQAGQAPQARLLPQVPPPPSPVEVARHNATHMPHAAWCSICRRARIKDDPHRTQATARRDDEEDSFVQVQIDYAFSTEGANVVTILTARMRSTGWSSAIPVPAKGPIAFAVGWLAQFLRTGGSQPYRIVTDAESSIASLAEAVAKELNNGTVVKRAPAGSHQSIGAAEKNHEMLHGSIRALRSQLEANLGRKVPIDAPLFTWLVRHAGWLQPRFTLYGSMSPHERLYGVPYDSPIVNFGEIVIARDPSATEGPKHAPRGHYGVWLGRAEATNEHIVALRDSGVIAKFRTVRRVTEGQSFDLEALRVGALPWKRKAALLPPTASQELPQDPRPAVHQPCAPVAPDLPTTTSSEQRAAEERAKDVTEKMEKKKERDGKEDDEERTVDAPTVPDVATKTGGHTMSARSRRKRDELGPTPGCVACTLKGIWGHGHRHNAVCRAKRAAWDQVTPEGSVTLPGEATQLAKRALEPRLAEEDDTQGDESPKQRRTESSSSRAACSGRHRWQ